MGLTIHYKLRLTQADEGMDDFQARWAVEDARKAAFKFKRQGRVDAVGAIRFDAEARRIATVLAHASGARPPEGFHRGGNPSAGRPVVRGGRGPRL